MFFDDYDAGRSQGSNEGYYAGVQYAINLLESEIRNIWQNERVGGMFSTHTANKLTVLLTVLKKERDEYEQ